MTTEQHALRAVADDALIVRKPFDLADVVRQVGAEIRLARRLMDVPTAQVPRDHHSNRTHQKSCTDIAK
jgi:hypothetical protein